MDGIKAEPKGGNPKRLGHAFCSDQTNPDRKRKHDMIYSFRQPWTRSKHNDCLVEKYVQFMVKTLFVSMVSDLAALWHLPIDDGALPLPATRRPPDSRTRMTV